MNIIMDLENKKDIPDDVRDEKIWELMGNFNQKIEFKMDKDPLSLTDYVNYVKRNPSKTIAIIDPETGYPKFILKYDKGQVKLYDNEVTISKFYDYNAKPESGSIPKEFYGDLYQAR